jgi:perosamine synthetase
MIPIARPQIGEDEKAAVLEVLASGQLAQGPRVREFEERFAELCGAKFAVATSSGTSALHIALLAHDIGPGDGVITTSFSFVASANCALYVGATPVFADIEPDYFTLDPVEVARRITPQTRAIIPVHLYGQSCNMPALAELAQAHNLILIEDACQAHGARFQGRPVGSWGTACYSFYPTKNMTTIEGGLLTTNDAAIADRARLLRDHGSPKRYVHQVLGYNLRLTDLQAAIGLAQLRKLGDWNAQRQANAAYLTTQLTGVAGVVTPKVREGAEHVYHQYTLRLENRDAAVTRLAAAGIGYGIHYPTPIHQQPLYCQLGYQDQLPNAEAACREVLSLPVHPALSRADLDHIVETISQL